MSALVDPGAIENIVGHARHGMQHLARADSEDEIVYILHSQKCKDSGDDLRDCPYSLALDLGIDPADWRGFEDRPVVVAIIRGRLFPVVPSWLKATR